MTLNRYYSVIKQLIAEKKLTYFSCFLSLIVLPLHVDYLPPVMILWVLSWAIENSHSFSEIFRPGNSGFILFVGFLSFFIWYSAGLLYTNDFQNGTLLIFRRLSFVVFPLVLIRPGEYIKKMIGQLLKVFALSTLFYILIAFIFAFYRSTFLVDGTIIFNVHPIDHEWDNYFYGTDFSFSQHPSYLAMYVLLSVFIAMDAFFDRSLKKTHRFFWLLTGIVLIGSIYFISSRAGILAALLLIPFYLIVQFKKLHKTWISISIVLLALSIMVFSFLTNSRIRHFIPEGPTSSFVEKFKSDNRVPIWKSALHVIRRHPLLGVGPGDASFEIRKAYRDAGYTEMYYDNLNAHNQYLEILLANGVVGFILIISIIAYMSYKAIKSGNLIFGLFILMILIFFFFESILNRIAGVTFFALLSFILLADSGIRNKNTEIEPYPVPDK